ncbi:tyrosine-type recombinase/integrase [Pseudofrankia sp. BMG5.37]|uniref:tyrosine-type recombinase/integrase n=1 Tax=Pseudofrankia sp. BMG5.37 TaxID=3050035 RepID=UPI002894FBCB|nr:tyrosine-type recombinase/integrase [Pseudofrankia sp. BMG5.37]MDT3444007.1 tyrosine-type recombinase/integrase [Pseudofrankia sp. BMG5.37]MDT3444185.1 tyrosine-type recombinase/integrase [Pseudofrankia sp. BMG5.37]MDT3444502.1 tyrosine-type recombinase/integrase [Pseudofrankia sp. BMG5.37]MDT3446417.1 tyrosine-type recombinase/integrase [Pseudofrankia sp. BMG5.37]
MKRADHLRPLYAERPDRTVRDRLEILTALIGGPSFDPMFRGDIVRIPRGHPIYQWDCVIGGCERVRGSGDLCSIHREQWARAKARGVGKAAFVAGAQPLPPSEHLEYLPCRVCPDRPADHTDLRLCQRHRGRWSLHALDVGDGADFAGWLGEQVPYPGYGDCQVSVCPALAASPLGLCSGHTARYRGDDQPGGAALPPSWWQRFEHASQPVPVGYTDEHQFRLWCQASTAMPWPGQLNLRGLRPLLRAEIQWGLFIHTRRSRPTRWDVGWVRTLVNTCRHAETNSLVDLDLDGATAFSGAIAKEILHELRLVYFTPEQAKDAGFLETDHFGVRFAHRTSHVDLTGIPQRWLRDLAFDYLADLLSSARRPRTAAVLDSVRRAAIELGVFLELDAPGGGHDPALLGAEHMRRFVADQRHRERDGLPSLAIKRTSGSAGVVTTGTRTVVFNAVRKLLRDAMDSGTADRLDLSREFIIAAPAAGGVPMRARRPFPDEVARALADETNLTRLAADYDPQDWGMRDIWETVVITGRRIGEVLSVRWDCLGRYGGLAMFWHDQTKVGNYDVAIRIPERLYEVLAARQVTTLDRFTAEHGRRPAGTERARLALFPTTHRNPDGTVALTHQWFHSRFRPWVDALDLGHVVPHQARHTLATNLLRHGASLSHIRRYLGHVSDRMAEHYVHLTQSDLENVLQHVWVAGPGAARPGELLAGDATPLSRGQAQALAVDLSRRSTPAEGGFCTFQPVVDGGACPWNLNCHSCDKFVLSGADLLYWRRKREQWRLLAEGAPDDATADYLHQYFEPTAHAIDGLEKALAGLGLLDDALALDLRKPQDYFHRVWSTAFRAADLAHAAHDEHDGLGDSEKVRR